MACGIIQGVLRHLDGTHLRAGLCHRHECLVLMLRVGLHGLDEVRYKVVTPLV